MKTLFDTELIRKRKNRLLLNGKFEDFLHLYAVKELRQRLSFIERKFENVLYDGLLTPSIEKELSNIPNLNFTKKSNKEETVQPYDCVLSLLTLQTVNNVQEKLATWHKSLKKDGLLLGICLGGATLTELRQSFLAAESALSNTATARIIPFIDIKDMGALLQTAAFALPVVDKDTLTIRHETPIALMQDLRAMGMNNPLKQRSKKPITRKLLWAMMKHYHEHFQDDDRRIRATFDLISFSGWTPHESQQKPLKPGSAKISMRDVL